MHGNSCSTEDRIFDCWIEAGLVMPTVLQLYDEKNTNEVHLQKCLSFHSTNGGSIVLVTV